MCGHQCVPVVGQEKGLFCQKCGGQTALAEAGMYNSMFFLF